ncbi:hypothetical protein ACIBBE_23830 [Streptomyces sp. NPDC051644]
MTAQPDHPVSGRIPAIPLTINAIGDSLSGEERAVTLPHYRLVQQ